MLSYLKNVCILVFAFFLFFFLNPSNVFAQACGNQTQNFVYDCDANCKPLTKPIINPCREDWPGHVASCVTFQTTNTCVKNVDSSGATVCNKKTDFTFVACGSVVKGCGGAYPQCGGSCTGGSTCKASAPSVNNPAGSCECKGNPSGTTCDANVLSIVQGASLNQMVANWTYTGGGTPLTQTFAMGTNKATVNAYCPAGQPGCLYAALLTPDVRSLPFGNLTYGTTYYIAVKAFNCNPDTGQYTVPVYSCTAPNIISVARTQVSSDTSPVRITWTPGTNTLSQTVYVGTNKNGVTNNCPGGANWPSCQAFSVSKTATTYTTPALTAGTVVYVKVTSGDICNKSSAIQPYVSSCVASPTNLVMGVNSSAVVQTQITDPNGAISRVTYSSANTALATVNPATDTDGSNGYKTTVSSNATAGSTSVTNNVYTGATLACTAQNSVTVIANNPWWQVINADVGTNGDLNSAVPGGNFFDTVPVGGGFPGVPVYGGNSSLNSSNVSTPQHWMANTSQDASKMYDSHFFANQIPSDVAANFNTIDPTDVSGSLSSGGTPDSRGYYWYKWNGAANGDLTLDTALDLGSRKVILLVDSADFYIKNSIHLTDGQGFFLAVVGKNADGTDKGNIFVDPSVGGGAVANLEGIYMADGFFKTGTTGTVDTKLWVRGSVTGYGGVALERDLGGGGNSAPAELFEYAPDQILLYPSVLGVRKISWKEISP